eukprot:6901521-Prymnesium_polylepis.1
MHELPSMPHQSMRVLHASYIRHGNCSARPHTCGSVPRPFAAVTPYIPEPRSRTSTCSAPVKPYRWHCDSPA